MVGTVNGSQGQKGEAEKKKEKAVKKGAFAYDVYVRFLLKETEGVQRQNV